MKDSRLVISNRRVFLEIAREAFAESISRRMRRESPGASTLLRRDPQQRSFKQALIAIAFSGIYLEALLHLEGSRRLGVKNYEKIDKSRYEDKLRALGFTASDLLADCKRFREARKALEHEKAFHPRSQREIKVAQAEAAHAIAFIERVREVLSAGADIR